MPDRTTTPPGSDNSDADPVLRHNSAGGLTGSHTVLDLPPAPVAPATAAESNFVQLPLRPVACWSMGDVRFAFDSSVIAPGAAEEFAQLAAIREGCQETLGETTIYPPLSLFGHADPVGDDEYNKQLSGRRARAVYAALIRDTAAWEELYTQSFAGDQWGQRSLDLMLGELAKDRGSDDASVAAFQRSENLPADGVAGPQTRPRLFVKYMDLLCGAEFKLDKHADFLARGADIGGKGDVQGCSEFNPVLMFSSTEQAGFQQASDHAARNAENAPNRRVLAFLFRPGAEVDPDKWPCPRVKEGAAGCRHRFWSDADKRRSYQAQRRVYEVSHDTFACRFYDRLAHRSPCERAVAVLRIRLHDVFGHKMPGVVYQIEYGSHNRNGQADRQGFLSETLDPDIDTCVVRWEPGGDGSSFLHELTVFITLLDLPTDEGVKRRLHNLGYPFDGDFEFNLRAFQAQHDVEVTGLPDDATKAKLQAIYAEALDDSIEPANEPVPSAPDSEQRT